MRCPFCESDPSRSVEAGFSPEIIWSSPLLVAIRDRFPVSPGHSLIFPRRHVASWFEATPEEQLALIRAIEIVKVKIEEGNKPDGYNIGFNDGLAAGQSVPHLHIHIIPRYHGDVDEPLGGLRYALPALGNYKAPGKIPRLLAPPPFWIPRTAPEHRLSTGGSDPFERQIRPALRHAERVDIVAAFVQRSGVDHLDGSISSALERGTNFRVLTGDYLNITQSEALQRLYDWSQFSRGFESERAGEMEVRIVETAALNGRSFHPKSWCVESSARGTAWVGSSNWSWMALTSGVEWNLRVDRDFDPEAYAEIRDAFELLWQDATVLTQAWLSDYAKRAKTADRPLMLGEAEDITAEAEYRPRGLQKDALAALAQTRKEGRERAMVVLATGLGKTFLAAFDVQAMAKELGRLPRVLFIAHRRELLIQAAKTFRSVFPDARIGFFFEDSNSLKADFVFASIQKLSRQDDLVDQIEDRFDYVIIDETHHAAASTYQRVLGQLEPRFLLGLTATPERADEADVLGIFDDHIAFRADLGDGIESERLVPFDYAGLPDTIDFEPIPWRSYSAEQLAGLAETEARMESLWSALQKYPGTRTLIFCVSIHHAEYVRSWLAERGMQVVACHSGPSSADRDMALLDLADGRVEAIATVDLFNEGVDVPSIDRVVMLRPTASSVLFLQQLGRGLRLSPDKTKLQVIDFIGNHKAFLNKVRLLLSLSKRPTTLSDFLSSTSGRELELRAGCKMMVGLEVIDMLSKFVVDASKLGIVRMYRELRVIRDERPTAGEMVRLGYSTASLDESWFGFVSSEGDLSESEGRLLKGYEGLLTALERRRCDASGLLLLEALLLNEAQTDASTLAQTVKHRLARDPELRKAAQRPGGDSSQATVDLDESLRVWVDTGWIRVKGAELYLRGPEASGDRAVFSTMALELLDMRLAQLRRPRGADVEGPSSFVCELEWRNGDPSLKLPNSKDLPQGEVDVRADDARIWQFRFGKARCTVARWVGSKQNRLPDLLRSWFGVQPKGSRNQVMFRRTADGWWVEPRGGALDRGQLGELLCFPSLKAAAGASENSQAEIEAAHVRLPIQGATGEGMFAVRAAGNSMNGGRAPIRDGDWVLMEWARSLGLGAVEGHVCLLAKGDPELGMSYHLKRVLRRDDGVVLASDNPDEAPLQADADTRVIAKMKGMVRPEDLAPAEGSLVDNVAEAFELGQAPRRGASRVDGHLFALVDDKSYFTNPDRLKIDELVPRPGETAYVLTAREGDEWRYAGVARQVDDGWAVPELDFESWRSFGRGRTASRRLEPEYTEQARKLAAFLGERLDENGLIEARGRSCRFLGTNGKTVQLIAPQMKSARSVTNIDLSWALKARHSVQLKGGVLDEGLLDRLRYLDGTPSGSRRFIDSGWALVLLEYAVRNGFVPG